MKQQSSLEQEYKKLMHQAAPDLWSRIEENLNERPRQVLRQEEAREEKTAPGNFPASSPAIYRWMTYATAVSAAAICLFVMASPWLSSLFPVKKQAETDAGFSGGLAAEGGISEETRAFYENDRKDQEPAAQHAGVLSYSQLDLAAYTSLPLPSQAVTLPEDTMYFSEDLLGDTELLCLGTVTSVALETDQSGNPAFLVYDIRLDSVCYSEDYTAGLESLTVISPIIEADGGKHQILYQLQTEAAYLLPLKKQENRWELLFPFAPQVQVTGDGAYLFHSGYTSLTDAGTFVVVGEQEGANDFYYDRMLLREDEDFLTDFISLVMTYRGEDI